MREGLAAAAEPDGDRDRPARRVLPALRVQGAGQRPAGRLRPRWPSTTTSASSVEPVEAYGPLIVDAMRGDQTLFKSRVEVEGRVERGDADPRRPVRGWFGRTIAANYAVGSWGPASADATAWGRAVTGTTTDLRPGDEPDRRCREALADSPLNLRSCGHELRTGAPETYDLDDTDAARRSSLPGSVSVQRSKRAGHRCPSPRTSWCTLMNCVRAFGDFHHRPLGRLDAVSAVRAADVRPEPAHAAVGADAPVDRRRAVRPLRPREEQLPADQATSSSTTRAFRRSRRIRWRRCCPTRPSATRRELREHLGWRETRPGPPRLRAAWAWATTGTPRASSRATRSTRRARPPRRPSCTGPRVTPPDRE
jgi:hypothetical protein